MNKALVIIPTYNEKENVRGIVTAVLEQSPNVEVLIVDDGSPDGTGDIVDALGWVVANKDKAGIRRMLAKAYAIEESRRGFAK